MRLRGKTEPVVRLALQRGQIVKLRRRLRGRLLLFDLDDAGFAGAFLLDGVGDLPMPQPRRRAMFVPQRTMLLAKPLLGIGNSSDCRRASSRSRAL